MSPFTPDPGVTDPEALNFVGRLEDRYGQLDMQPREARRTYVDPIGYGRWTSSYWFKRQTGQPHEQATQAVLSEIDDLIHPKPTPLRPTATTHAPLPPFDQSDADGQVHTTKPPELVIPTGPDALFMRADFAGVTLDTNRWGGNPPMLVGANSTPRAMLMTPMLPMYPKPWQDACLTEHAERGYTHFVVAADGWNMPENGFSWSPQQFADWCRYVQSWGFYIVYWGRLAQNDYSLIALVDNHAIDFHIVGEEVDTKVSAEIYEDILDNALAITANGVPTAAHFTSNYPEGFPRDTFLTNWDKYDGRVHLCWQADQNESAGKQGARLYYARQRVNLGLVGGNGQPALHSRVYAFETMASKQLYGQCDEVYGNLRSLELLYTTRLDDRIRPVSGFGNGCRYPDGSPL